jgi:integrase
MASIEPRDRNGKRTYRVRYRDPAGRQRSRSFARKVDAQRWLHENETARAHGAWVDPAAGKITFGAWAERWYASTAALRASSRYAYRQDLDRYLLPTFAAVPLDRIGRLQVRTWFAGLVDQGLSVATARKALAALGLVLAAAVEDGRLAGNVAKGLKLPKVQRTEQLALDAVGVERLAAAITPRYRVLVLFAAWTGLRPSELAALRVGRLDLLRGTVRVVEAAVRVKGRRHWGDTKTSQERTVHLPRWLRAELAADLAG